MLSGIAESGSCDARRGAVYVRRGTESVEASQAELQRIINERLATGRSTAAALSLTEHFDQLEVLEARIPRYLVKMGASSILKTLTSINLNGLLGSGGSVPNPDFPQEDVKAFTFRMFEAKKKRIERELDVG